MFKTIQLAHKSTEINRIKRELPSIEFDENYLAMLESKVKDKKERVANVVFTLNRLILNERSSNPAVDGLTEKVQFLMDKWKQKNVNFEEMYQEGASIIRQINERNSRQKGLKLSDAEYSVLLILEEKWKDLRLIDDAKFLIHSLRKRGLLFPGCFEQKAIAKEIEKEIRRFIRKNYVISYRIGLSEIDKLSTKIIESLRYHTES